YLLLLGDADQLSWELQQRLASSAFPGRLRFSSERGYEAYADKVLRSERPSRWPPGARALFFSALDGSEATAAGHAQLMEPSVALAHARRAAGTFPVTEIVSLSGPKAAGALLEQVAHPEPAILFSMSHGLGAPRFGWDSPEEQRARQGALCL